MKSGDLLIGIMASLGRPRYGASGLVALAKPLGTAESAVRVSLSRLAAKGVLEACVAGGRAGYAFSGKGLAIADNIGAGFSPLDWSGWEGEYWGAAWSLPAEDKNGRYRLAKKLAAYRFAPLLPGFWIRPRNGAERMDERLASLIEKPGFTFMAFRPLKPFSSEMAAKLWNTAGAAVGMRKALDRGRRIFARLKAMEPEDAFAERYRSGGMMVDALFSDPLLPPAFLPPDWPAPELRKFFKRFDDAMARRSRPFWEGVIGKDRSR